MDYVNLVILLALVEYAIFILLVGATRTKYNVEAPATTGNEQWVRLHRIQVNTTEQLILFIPAILAFAWYVNPAWAAGLGSIFLVGRALYFVGYGRAANKRLPGAIMTSFTSYIMVIGALIGLALELINA